MPHPGPSHHPLTDLLQQDSDDFADALVRKLAYHQAYHRLTGGLVHRLNNHLQGVRFGVPFLTGEETEDPPPIERLRDLVGNGTAGTLAGVEDLSRLLALVRSSSPMTARDIAAQATGWARYHPDATRTHLEYMCAPDLPAVIMNPFDTTCGLSLLLNNAVESTRETGTPSVTIGVDSTDHAVSFTVVDNGPGVEPFAERMFEAGVSGKDGYDGLGLTLAAWLAGRCGGTVQLVRDEPGHTAVRFTVSVS